MNMILFVIVILFCNNLPSDLCLFGKDLHGPPPCITGPSDVPRFASDQRGIGSCRMSIEAIEVEVQCIEENDFGNVRSATCIGAPKRLVDAGRGSP